jgi:hypothetical protein
VTQDNTSIAPQVGPHASTSGVETTYEIEVMHPASKHWQQTTAMTGGRPFVSAEAAWEFWFELAATSDLWRGAQARLVQHDRRVLPSVAEPVDGWEAYHRRVALASAPSSAHPAYPVALDTLDAAR